MRIHLTGCLHSFFLSSQKLTGLTLTTVQPPLDLCQMKAYKIMITIFLLRPIINDAVSEQSS